MLKRQPADRRRDVDRSGLITGICYSVFVPLITRPRREYRNHVHSFVLAMMRQLPTDNRKQKRAYMNSPPKMLASNLSTYTLQSD
jgi:hypothetical protein